MRKGHRAAAGKARQWTPRYELQASSAKFPGSLRTIDCAVAILELHPDIEEHSVQKMDGRGRRAFRQGSAFSALQPSGAGGLHARKGDGTRGHHRQQPAHAARVASDGEQQGARDRHEGEGEHEQRQQ